MSEWKECKLGVITSKIGSGATPTGGGNAYKIEGISLIRSQNVLDFNFSEDGLAYIDQNQAHELRNVEVLENDILINITGESVTRCCIVPKKYLPARVNQHVSIIRPIAKHADFRFVLYYIHAIKPELHSMAEIGCTRRALTKGMLEQIEILLPPLPEQRAIAAILSSLDDKIDLLHRQNNNLEAMAETIFRQWFIEDVDAAWEETNLAFYADNIHDHVNIENLGKHANYVGLEHIPRKNIALLNWGNTDTLESNKSIFKVNDILFGKLRSYFHKVVFAPVEGVCSTDILVVRPKKSDYFPFCLFWFYNEKVVEHSDLGSGGTRMPRTNWEILSSYKIPKPDDQLIIDFNKIALPMLEKITFNIKQIKTLEKLRDTMLPKLMSGEVRVSL